MVDNNLKKEVEGLLAQGYTSPQIKQHLTDKGFSVTDINEAIVHNQPKAPRKLNLTLILVPLIVILLIVGGYILLKPEPVFEPVYTNNPTDWIIEEGENKVVDIDLVSGGDTFIDNQGQQFRQSNVATVFTTYGYYKGNSFANYHENNMKITTNMTPGDGVIEGYIVFDIVNEKPTFYFFVDSDWKNQVSPTNIWWGFSSSNKKEFTFTEVSPGVYMDKIIDDNSSFASNYNIHLNKIFIGDMTEEKINSSDSDITMIIVK